jgi:ornithine cyclodeaminase/alanine dehydrogenase-like protein (mu-crystallin family)
VGEWATAARTAAAAAAAVVSLAHRLEELLGDSFILDAERHVKLP